MAETTNTFPGPNLKRQSSSRGGAHAILGRLSQAVRDIWFAVGLEGLIVIGGAVIGSQITACGNEGDLRDREAVPRAASRYDVALGELDGPTLICLSR